MEIACCARGAGVWVILEEVCWDLDEVCVEGFGEGEPKGQFLGEEGCCLATVEEALVEAEGLQADDGEVEGFGEG